MVNSKELLRRARASEDGEAYVAVAKGPGFRIGVGARTATTRDAIFVEILLDPFPERPRVIPERLADQAEIVESLQARGYDVACEEDGTITCEGRVTPARMDEEIRSVRRLLGSNRGVSPRG